MSWKIEFTKTSTKQIHNLDFSIQQRIKDAIVEKLLTNQRQTPYRLAGIVVGSLQISCRRLPTFVQ